MVISPLLPPLFIFSQTQTSTFLLGFKISPIWFSFFVLKTGETIALGFQHYILALGTAVMIPTFRVPLMGGDDVS